MRALPRSIVFVMLTALVGVGLAAPANAQDPPVERPVMYFTFSYDAIRQQVCGVGELRLPPTTNPTWTLTLTGLRSSGIPISLSGSTHAQNGLVSVCLTVMKDGANAGTYLAEYRYESLPDDPPSDIQGHAIWAESENKMASTGQ